jgi:hypothetical protein
VRGEMGKRDYYEFMRVLGVLLWLAHRCGAALQLFRS